MADKVKLSEDRLVAIKEIFSLFDKDNDGAITTRQTAAVLRSVGFNPAEAEVRALVDEFDPEGEGMLDFVTFVQMVEKVRREGESAAELEEAFLVFDQSGSGTISTVDLRQLLTGLGERLSDDEADDLIAFADRGGKGEVNYLEFIQTLLSDA